MKDQIQSKSTPNTYMKTYTSWADLQNFAENEDVCEVIKKIASLIKISDNWNNNIEAINLLRRLNKFKKSIFNTTFDLHYKTVGNQYLNSPRSCLLKIALILIGEVFSEISTHKSFSDWLEFLIPIVIKKNIIEKNFIQEEAKVVLENITKNIHITESFTIFLKVIQDKNTKYSLKAYELFLDLIQEIDLEKIKTAIKWEAIFRELIELSKMKRDPYGKRLNSLISVIIKKFSEETLEKLLSDMLNKEDYLFFTKSDMISLNESFSKAIQEEKSVSTQQTTEKCKIVKSLKEHIKSLKKSEKMAEAENNENPNEVKVEMDIIEDNLYNQNPQVEIPIQNPPENQLEISENIKHSSPEFAQVFIAEENTNVPEHPTVAQLTEKKDETEIIEIEEKNETIIDSRSALTSKHTTQIKSKNQNILGKSAVKEPSKSASGSKLIDGEVSNETEININQVNPAESHLSFNLRTASKVNSEIKARQLNSHKSKDLTPEFTSRSKHEADSTFVVNENENVIN